MQAIRLPNRLFRAADVRAMDLRAIREWGVSGMELMERAGASVFKAAQARWPGARTLSVVTGGGNNGGDGFIVARLAHLAGWDVRVFPVFPPETLKDDAALAFQRYRDAGGALLHFIPEDFEGSEILVDGLFGTGLNRPVDEAPLAVIHAINRYRERGLQHHRNQRGVLALDIPSGLSADTGQTLGSAVKADLTVTFVGLKQGLFTGDGPDRCGEILFEDLDLDPRLQTESPCSARLLERFRGLPPRLLSSHKGMNGHVLIVGGNLGFGGAPRLSGEAALRIGAGLVTVAARPPAALSMQLGCPELMCHGVDTPDSLVPLIEAASLIAIGPGLGQDAWAEALLNAVLESSKPLVVDADALNLLARRPIKRSHWVLTPHPGEAARLLGTDTAAIQKDRFSALSQLVKTFGGTAVLKGSGSLIQSDDQTPEICRHGNPGMATGGMGDVLTGVIAGLVAQGLSLPDAARRGVQWHALAADRAAEGGQRGLMASDLMPHLRTLVNQGTP